ncbi:hypothetical protein [Mucilaginibacter psychrotolerans]|uniref:Uncharacterized protein n=1 Tax=Mucilaginibacter psychrotolerans TaxID=1524096 RepID=A0A4Y8S5G3_9SPHI|nr:hypothetical protein [Mucilaginibacter psychrotolerans]TFF33891.1 hypothetical protein E2R66_23730 [Mucilaginibacter psychrotolerans]
MMREKFTLKADESLLRQLIANEISPSAFFATLFGQKQSAHYRAMCEGLVAYHNKDGGSPEVTEFEITDSGFKPEKSEGYLKCKFGIHFHYTCSDVHNDANDTIRWDFILDEATNTIRFTGEEPWVRDAE